MQDAAPPAVDPDEPTSAIPPAPLTLQDVLMDALIVRTMRDQYERQAAATKELAREIEAREAVIIGAMQALGANAVNGNNIDVKLKPRRVFKVLDWTAMQQHIQRTGEFDLLTKAVSLTAMRERENAGVLPAGVEGITFPVIKIEWSKRP